MVSRGKRIINIKTHQVNPIETVSKDRERKKEREGGGDNFPLSKSTQYI
jgi:hypothetical protein